MRRKRGADQGIAAVLVAQLQGFVDVVIGVAGPDRGKVEHDQADVGADANLARNARRDIGEEIHIVEAGSARAQHFGDREFTTIVNKFFADPLGFSGPDVIGQPVHQRQVIGYAAE